jgi:integrase
LPSAHSIAKQPFDRATLRNDLKGIRRLKARKPRQAFALVGVGKDPKGIDLRGILSDLGESAIDVRDRLLLSLGFAGALRRSELVGLDWKQQGAGTGYVTRDNRGITITLLTSKGGAGEPVGCYNLVAAKRKLRSWPRSAVDTACELASARPPRTSCQSGRYGSAADTKQPS